MKTDVPFRQVHLDFHNSGLIPELGEEFDPVEFALTLERAHVNSVTCFARCHHGYVYYNTHAFPERLHPNLKRDLLREQIDACHERGIRVPIYITVQWDHFTAEEHPEWLMVDADGRFTGTPPHEPGFYRRLCLNSPYVGFLQSFTQEVLETLPVDGLFFDIVDAPDCSCIHCRRAMRSVFLDPADPEARRVFGRGVLHRFQTGMTAFVRRFNSDCSIFYNAGHIGPRHRPLRDTYTHFELESLPSGGWGYMHFPLAMRYARTLDMDCLGMTGKFHTSWGDFHSFKNPAALEFECFHMLALGAKCSVGDQLHPSGRICPNTYALIGGVYKSVAEKEPWCRAARGLADIAILTPEAFGDKHQPKAAIGAVRMLQEGQHQFDIIDAEADLARYAVVILPDEVPLDEALTTKVSAYLGGGGALIASYRSGLRPDGKDFALGDFGLRLVGDAPYSPDFIIPGDEISGELAPGEYVMYLRGLEVTPGPGADRLAEVAAPYFNRTREHFCSHRHTPSSHNIRYPGIVRKGSVIYFAHPIFTQYHANAPRWCKTLLLNALDMLLPEPLVWAEVPSSAIVTVNEQADKNRWVLHLLHYVPERRGEDFDTIEDVIPLLDVRVSLRVPHPVDEVTLVPGDTPLSWDIQDGRINFTVPEVDGHQMISVAFLQE